MRNVLAAVMIAVLAAAAHADPVQFVIQQQDGQRYYAAIVPVMVLQGNRWTRFGYTDRFGRINLNLPPGRYEFAVQARDRDFRINLQLTGASGLRGVLLQ